MIEIIPAIDIIGGKCVRLTKGDYATSKSYTDDVVSLAKSYEDIGIKRLHIVDLDGAKAAEPQNLRSLEMIANATNLDIQYGGGIKSAESLQKVLSAGANRAICGSIAVTEPDMFRGWIEKFGSDHIILGADIKDGCVATHGWLKTSELTIEQVIENFSAITQIICTDISKDGMLQGPNFELYQTLQSAHPDIDITVSGGISCMEDILRLNEMNLRSVIVGKAIYEGHITINQLKECLQRG